MSNYDNEYPEYHTHFCKLDNGRFMYYDMACTREDFLTKDFYDFYTFIGCGTIYKINGVLQNSNTKLFFFIKNE